MQTRTIVIFSIFILVVIIFSIFIYFYGGEVDKLIQKYIKKIAICENILNEQECYSNDFCEGIFQPACPNCKELVFKRCQRIPDKILSQLQKEKELCALTGGEWNRNKLGSFCLCSKTGLNKVFNKEKGCVSKNNNSN